MSTPACVAFNFGTKEEQAITVEQVAASCRDGLFCWIDVDCDANPEAARAALQELAVNRHAVEEALGPDSDGRHDLYDDCLHIAVTAAHFKDGKLAPSHVDMLIGEGYMITLRRGQVEFVEQVRRHYKQDFRKFAKTGSFLLYEYWDALIDSYKRAMRAFEGHAERVQAKIFETEDDTLFEEVSEVTRDLLHFRKMLLASREVLSEISSRRSPFISESTQPFLERMASTLERLSADLTVERETLAETLNLYMGIVSHRTNRVVNRLTVISMVFLPLTFLCGVYGMNFAPDAGGTMPELGWKHGYLAFWVVTLVTAAALLLFMKRKRWW
jgi:magnesium transporter